MCLWQCFIIIFYKKRAYVIFRGFDQFGTDSQTECNAAIANSSEVIIQLKVWGPLCPEVKSGMCILHTGLQLLQVFLMMDGIREAEKRNQGFRLLLILSLFPPFVPRNCPLRRHESELGSVILRSLPLTFQLSRAVSSCQFQNIKLNFICPHSSSVQNYQQKTQNTNNKIQSQRQ